MKKVDEVGSNSSDGFELGMCYSVLIRYYTTALGCVAFAC